jgi:hypothetical protein
MESNMKEFMGAFAGIVFAVGIINIAFPAPSLVGYGCDGAGGPIFAYEESEFPMCLKIEAR